MELTFPTSSLPKVPFQGHEMHIDAYWRFGELGNEPVLDGKTHAVEFWVQPLLFPSRRKCIHLSPPSVASRQPGMLRTVEDR